MKKALEKKKKVNVAFLKLGKASNKLKRMWEILTRPGIHGKQLNVTDFDNGVHKLTLV